MSDLEVPGAPCWVELFTADTEAAIAFYGELFGWTATESDATFGGYRLFLSDGAPVAGLMDHHGQPDAADVWSVYLATSDIAATVGRATRLGAQLFAGPMQVGDLGHMAMLVDPAGAAVGAWQAITFPGFTTRGSDNAPAWFETLSRDYARSVAFYRDAFGWRLETMSDTPEFRYTTLGRDEHARAGIMDAAGFLSDAPSRWQFYVQVSDTDATVERAVAAGGSLVAPVDDTPYGRLGGLVDPAGVPFHVMGPTSGA